MLDGRAMKHHKFCSAACPSIQTGKLNLGRHLSAGNTQYQLTADGGKIHMRVSIIFQKGGDKSLLMLSHGAIAIFFALILGTYLMKG